MSEIKKGDRVQLKSGGPIMTVSGIGDYSMSKGIENGALCVWFDGKEPKERVFDLDTIEKVEE